MAAADLTECAAVHRVQQVRVEESVTIACVENVPPPVCLCRIQDGLREEVDDLGDLVFEGTPGDLDRADQALQKQSDRDSLEDDGQLTPDEGVPPKLTMGAEENRDPGGAASCVVGSIFRRECWSQRGLTDRRGEGEEIHTLVPFSCAEW